MATDVFGGVHNDVCVAVVFEDKWSRANHGLDPMQHLSTLLNLFQVLKRDIRAVWNTLKRKLQALVLVEKLVVATTGNLRSMPGIIL